MASFMKEFEHLRIQLEEIKSATHNFDRTKVIGSGGFGKVYEAEVSHSKGKSLVAVKCLDRKFGQGDPEFWKEIMMLSRYSHKNLISLLGFCDEAGDKILVYEYASNGSLDRHLSSKALTWSQRIKICLDAARGLSYLHDDKGTQQRVLHRDIKSANILLDEKWNAKISDLGLSKLGPANQQHTALVTGIVGTIGYLDPMYLQMCVLTKESDVYSFGVVLMEVLCGKLCFQKNINGTFSTLVQTWKKSFKTGQLDKIIFQDVMQPLHPDSLRTFSKIAFQCLNKYREGRPLMSLVVKELETSLKLQEPHDLKPLSLPVQLGEITAEELKEYDGRDPNKPLLMAIKGQIYDVTESRMFYGPGGPYAVFGGKDASLGLAKMSFEEKDLTSDISGLGVFELNALADWECKFMSKYVKVGTIKTEETIHEPSTADQLVESSTAQPTETETVADKTVKPAAAADHTSEERSTTNNVKSGFRFRVPRLKPRYW